MTGVLFRQPWIRAAAALFVLSLVLSIVVFFVKPPVPKEWWERLDAEKTAGVFSVVSGAGVLVAERSFGSWNEFHGGEHPLAKLLECTNPAGVLFVRWLREGSPRACLSDYVFVSSRAESWLLALAFLLGAACQWLLLCYILHFVGKAGKRGL